MRGMVQAVSAVMCGLALGAVLAQAEQVKPAGPAAVDPAMEAAMAAMEAYGTPGETHKALEAFAGEWTYTGTMRMAPEAPAEPMTGTASHRLIFGGRFLQQDVTGAMAGHPPFEGIGYTGYDNLRKEYASVWFSNMGTGIMTATGQFDPATRTLTQSCDFSCPLTQEAHRTSREVWRVIDPDHTTYESYMRTPEGQEFKAMEIQYARAQ